AFADPLDLTTLGRDFRRRHHEIYGYATDEHWEMQSLRLRTWVGRRMEFGPLDAPHGIPQPTSIAPCWFDPSAPRAPPRSDRDRLPAGVTINGPAIVEDAWSTIIVPPDYALRADAQGHLWINEVLP